jgi:hypothetical protein
MDRVPSQSDLTPGELRSLREIANGFRSRAMCGGSIGRLIELELVQQVMGGLMITPAGRMVARR